MPNAPKFSAVIATYNRREYLLQAVQSVVEQTYPAHEIIVAVDGSTDGSAEAVRARFPGVKIVEQPNLGRSIAVNTAVSQATGDWLCFLDDDDIWHREKLARTRDFLAENPDCQAGRSPLWTFGDPEEVPDGRGVDFACSDIEELHRLASSGKWGSKRFDYLRIKGNSFKLMLERNRGAYSSTFLRRELFQRVGGLNPSATHADDWKLFLDVARVAEWHTLEEPLIFYRIHPGSDTATNPNATRILAGKVAAWCCGRAMPARVTEVERLELLRGYGGEYRREVQSFLWGALRRGRLREAAVIAYLGAVLLPRFRDRAYAAFPPQVTWRVERSRAAIRALAKRRNKSNP